MNGEDSNPTLDNGVGAPLASTNEQESTVTTDTENRIAQTANLISNGSFEDQLYTGGRHLSPADWVLEGTENAGGLHRSANRASDGDQYFAFGGWGRNSGATLSQTIDTVAGQTYQISFNAGVNVGSGSSEGRILAEALADGQSIVGEEFRFSLDEDTGTHTLTFVATSDQTTIRFTDTSDLSNGDIDVDFDNVQVVALDVEPLTGSISGRYFEDLNDNGVQDAGERGLAGVEVHAINGNTGQQFSAVTDADGDYTLSDLVPGDYIIHFESVGAEYTFVDANIGGDDSTDSDVIRTDPDGDGVTASINVSPGQDIVNVDAGVALATGSISGRYFEDLNHNGIQDAGETGLAGITVYTRNDTTGEWFNTVTDADGNYSFSDLDAGQYFLRFGNAGDDYSFVDANVGGDDTRDSDIINVWRNGVGVTDVIDLAQGQDVANVDAGVALPITGSISGRYFEDANGNGVQDAGETGLSGIEVFSRNNSTGEWLNTITDADGNYTFTGLDDGQYVIHFGSAGEGYSFVTANIGEDSSIDSDVIGAPPGGNGITDTISISSAQDINNIDAGVVFEEPVPDPVPEEPEPNNDPAQVVDSLFVQGGDGDDLLVGGFAADVILAGAGNDIIYGDNENQSIDDVEINEDEMIGFIGEDTIDAGAGDDIIYGGANGNLIFGDTGNDAIHFNTGADTYSLVTAEFDQDVIYNFEDGTDLIDFAFTGVTINDVSIESVEGSTLISLISDPSHSIRLEGVDASLIDAEDFLNADGFDLSSFAFPDDGSGFDVQPGDDAFNDPGNGNTAIDPSMAMGDMNQLAGFTTNEVPMI